MRGMTVELKTASELVSKGLNNSKNIREPDPKAKAVKEMLNQIRTDPAGFCARNNGIACFEMRGNKTTFIANGGHTYEALMIASRDPELKPLLKDVKVKLSITPVADEKEIRDIAAALNTVRPIKQLDVFVAAGKFNALKAELLERGIPLACKSGQTSEGLHLDFLIRWGCSNKEILDYIIDDDGQLENKAMKRLVKAACYFIDKGVRCGKKISVYDWVSQNFPKVDKEFIVRTSKRRGIKPTDLLKDGQFCEELAAKFGDNRFSY
jgi:hypothetical protein